MAIHEGLIKADATGRLVAELQRFREVAEQAAREGGKIAHQYLGNVTEQFKSDMHYGAALFTQADVESENAIISVLEEAFPDHGIYDEERGHYKEGRYTWYIDPIDGTRNYVRGSPSYGIGVGLLDGDEAVVDVLWFPEHEVLCSAAKGHGATINGQPVVLADRPVAESYFSMGVRSLVQLGMETMRQIGDVRYFGACSIEYLELLRGHMDGMLRLTSLHDDVAGIAILLEAGARVSNLEGKPWRSGDRHFIATTPGIHEEALRIAQGMPW